MTSVEIFPLNRRRTIATSTSIYRDINTFNSSVYWIWINTNMVVSWDPLLLPWLSSPVSLFVKRVLLFFCIAIYKMLAAILFLAAIQQFIRSIFYLLVVPFVLPFFLWRVSTKLWRVSVVSCPWSTVTHIQYVCPPRYKSDISY